MSDFWPLFGYRRRPYILLASGLGVIAWSLLYFLPHITSSLKFFSFLLFLGNLSIAVPDVMIDGTIAEKNKIHSNAAADLQTLCWMSFGVGKIISTLTAGSLLAHFGSQSLYGFTAFTALAVFIPTAMRWLGQCFIFNTSI